MDGRVRRWRPWAWAAAVVFGLGIGLGLVAIELPSAALRARAAPLVPLGGLVLLQVLVLLLAAAVHWLGHAVAARVAGVGPAGLDAVEPTRLRARHAAMVAGGPAADLALAGAAICLAGLRGGLPLWLTAATLTVSGLVSLLPLELGAGARWTDGRWLRAWLLRPEQAAQRVGTEALRGALASGRRPSEWDRRWAELAATCPRRPADRVQVVGCLLAYASALDRGDVDEAALLITRAFSARRRLAPGARLALAMETAFFVARYRRDAPLAERLLESDAGAPLPALEANLERALAAVHLAAGRQVEALAACDRALAALDRPVRRPAGAAGLERELVLAMREEARRALPSDTVPYPAALPAQ